MSDKQTVKFGDICREVKLTTKDPIADGYERYIGLEHLDSGSLKIKRWGMIAEDNPSFTRVFKKGHILFGKRRPYLKKAAIAEFDGICSGDIIVLEPKDAIDPDMLPFITQSEGFWDWAVKTSSGSLSPRTKFKSLADYVLSQNLIGKQSAILPVLKAVKGCLSNNDKLSTSIEMVNKAIDSNLIGEIFNASKVELGKLVLKADDGPFGSKLKTEHYVPSDGTRVVRLQNIQKGYFDYSDEAFIDTAYAESDLAKHKVLLNDVLIAGLGDDTYPVGRACIYDSEYPAINKADCFRVRANKTLILPEFLMFILNSMHMRHALAPLIQGVTRQRVNLSNLKKLPIPTPSMEKQEELVSILRNAQKTYELVQAKQLKMNVLLQRLISNY